MLSLNVHGKVSGKSWKNKNNNNDKKKKQWKRDQNEIALTEISVNKFLNTCCFAPFFSTLTNKYICKKTIYIDHT